MRYDDTRNPQSPSAARRAFLKSGAALGAGLAVGFRWCDAVAASGAGEPAQADPSAFEPNAWVRVFPDDTIKLVVAKHDSGTGTHTALPAVVAEELDVDPFRVDVITPENPFFIAYIHPLWHVFSTGGSTSVSLEYTRLRHAGATARAMLVAAAAKRWRVAAQACTTDNGRVLHASSGRSASYGELAEQAARLPVPDKVTLKRPADFKYIGHLMKKRGAFEKSTGRFRYSIDVELPDMLVAVVEHAPVINARVRAIDASAALAVPGVRQVLKIPAAPTSVLGGNQEGVAVLADTYWAAQSARQRLKITWDDGAFAHFDSAALPRLQAQFLGSPAAAPVSTVSQGDAARALHKSERLIEAEYLMPYKAQNPLEPICVSAQVKDGTVTFWGGLQVPSTAREAARVVTGIPAERVVLHDMVSGGSFGAHESKYWLYEVVYLAKATGRPIKLMHSREDEMRALYYHAATYHKLRGALGSDGQLDALQLRAVCPASPEQWEPGYTERPDKMDYSTTEAISKWDFAYRAPNLDLAWVRHETGVPTGWYRAVSFIPNVFALESFIDELAHAAGIDPLAYRLAHMHDRPRHVEVLRQAAERAGWAQQLPEGTALGLATNQAYGSYVAVVARVQRHGDGANAVVSVQRLTCVVDCGLMVSPAGVEEQIYGGLMWGLGHALLDRVDIEGGRVRQGNFDTYRVMRMDAMPEIDIVLIQGDVAKPGGVGELSSPSVAPAVANALFRLTGVRQRATPLKLT